MKKTAAELKAFRAGWDYGYERGFAAMSTTPLDIKNKKPRKPRFQKVKPKKGTKDGK